ncbi:UNVERIFIED_CONTAM: hypothetical protein Sindi_2694900 [Sesamum indicum]
MSSGMRLVPRYRDRGPPLPTVPSNASQIGKAVLRPPPPPDTAVPLFVPQTADDAGPSRVAPAAAEAIEQSVAPSPPPATPHHQHASILASMTQGMYAVSRGHQCDGVGTLSPPVAWSLLSIYHMFLP